MDRPDLIVIGGGSGGLAVARRAAACGKRVTLIEADRLGGTCVNRGCVPKKLWHDAACAIESQHDLRSLGFQGTPLQPSWSSFRPNVDAYVERLNGVYARNLERDGVLVVQGRAAFVDTHRVRVGDAELEADTFVIATGMRPRPLPVPGAERALSSDAFFTLDQVPGSVVVIGGGYIGVEFAGILRAFGAKVTVVEFLDRLLAPFDPEVSEAVQTLYEKLGIEVHLGTAVQRIDAEGDRLRVVAGSPDGRQRCWDAEIVLSAVGRQPNVEALGLERAGVLLDERGFIRVNAEDQTTAPHVFALGDVAGRPALTPVAIKAGRKLADRLYAGGSSLMNYDVVPTAVFSPVEIGVVGMSEPQARQHYGDDAVRVYRTSFKPMRRALVEESPVRVLIKLITAGAEERVVGLHIVSPEASEIIQGYAVAVTAGLTKAQFDDTIAIHPSISEEVVTLR